MATFLFADSETTSRDDVTVSGAYKYSRHPTTDVTVWGLALDDDPVELWSPAWAWAGKPDAEPTAALDHIENGGYVVAWNSAFDRLVYNEVMPRLYGWPEIRLEQWLCAQAQAEGNNLPGKLEKACEALGVPHKKDKAGGSLIKLLSVHAREDFDAEQFLEPMGRFRAYCLHDVEAMRDVWQCTRPLTEYEWHEFWTSERINDRGVAVDVAFARAAAEFAKAEETELDAELEALLLAAHEVIPDEQRNSKGELFGPVFSINNHKRKAAWLHSWLWRDEELQQLTERPPKVRRASKLRDADEVPRYSCDRSTREAVLELMTQPEHAEALGPDADRVTQFLEIIEAGNSAAVRKFSAMANQAYDGRVHGSYSFNGAGQTGRFSSRGVQVHNLIRDPLDYDNADLALDAIEDILDGAEADELRDRYGLPVSRLLARLIRPSFIAPEGRMLVWGDWGQIEGRCLPWLADSPASRAKLELYRAGVDTYKVAAMPIYGLASPEDADKQQRQVGKVSELALGFGGATGAFGAMARGYGVSVPEPEARRIVDAWRMANAWAPAFWHELWAAAIAAWQAPGVWHHAGKVRYCYMPALMRGTLVCQLPDGRWLVYPQFKHERRVEIEVDADGNEREVTRMVTSFMRGWSGGAGRIELWYGTLAENITQATAASLLRRTLNRLDAQRIEVVLHTHDEVVIECNEADVDRVAALLRKEMLSVPKWAEGLPLAADIETGPYYTK